MLDFLSAVIVISVGLACLAVWALAAVILIIEVTDLVKEHRQLKQYKKRMGDEL